MSSKVRSAGDHAGVVLIAVLAGTLTLTGACTHKTPTGSPTSAPASPTVSPSPTADPAVAKAVDAYNGYFKAYAAAAAVANPDDPTLDQYIGGPLLSLSRHNLRNLKDHGAVELGNPKTTVTGTQANLTASPPTVTVQACVDYTDYRLVYQKNQSPVPNGALKQPRYTTTATVTLFADGRWLVSGDAPHRDTPC